MNTVHYFSEYSFEPPTTRISGVFLCNKKGREMLKRILILLIMAVPLQTFATDVTGGETCDTNVLNTDTGPVNLRAEFEPENINLHWYNGDNQITVPTASNSCTYDTPISLPANPVKPGYKFKGWKIINAVPTGYTGLKYIEGGTLLNAYIDLGYPATPTMQTLLTASIEYDFSGQQVLLGVSDQNGFSGKPYAIDRMPDKVYIPNGNYSYSVSTVDAATSLGTVYQFKINYPTIGTIGVNDITKTAFTNITSVASRNLCVFYYNGTSSENNSYASVRKMRLYGLKIWDNGTMIHNYVPAKNSNNVIGLYDMETGAFLTNAGTGDFIAGPEI